MFLVICNHKDNLQQKIELLIKSTDKKSAREIAVNAYPDYRNFMIFEVHFDQDNICVINETLG